MTIVVLWFAALFLLLSLPLWGSWVYNGGIERAWAKRGRLKCYIGWHSWHNREYIDIAKPFILEITRDHCRNCPKKRVDWN